MNTLSAALRKKQQPRLIESKVFFWNLTLLAVLWTLLLFTSLKRTLDF